MTPVPAILKSASIGWRCVYDEQGEATGRVIIIGIDFMQNVPNSKRYGFTRQTSEEAFEYVTSNDVTRRKFVKNTIVLFRKAVSRYDCLLSKEDVERLEDELCRGLEKFASDKDWMSPWYHIFTQTTTPES